MMATRIHWRPACVLLVCALASCSNADSSDGGVLDGSLDGSLVGRDDASSPEAGIELPDGFLESTSCEGIPDFLVARNLRPNSECVASLDNPQFLPTGLYDVSSGPSPSGDCDVPYRLLLLVMSCLPPIGMDRFEGSIVQLHSAEIRLTDLDHRTILFDRTFEGLPNPFLVTTNNSLAPSDGATDGAPSYGVAVVEAIPTRYGDELDGFVGTSILAEVRIFATTTGDRDLEARTFVYPIELCDGCLSFCSTAFSQSELDEQIGDECPDNAGADGRVCIDHGC